MKTVYRVQNSDLDGPYHAGAVNDWGKDLRDAHNGPDRPGPSPFCLYPEQWDTQCNVWAKLQSEKYIFGFASIAQLKEWFCDSLKSLPEQGFVIAEYRIPEKNCIVGKTQVMFAPGAIKPSKIHDFAILN